MADEARQETLVKDISWDAIGGEQDTTSSKYFKPELNVRYDITIASAKAVEKTFAGKTEPTKMVEMQLATLNGEPTEKVWSCGSWLVMKVVKGHVKAGTLTNKKFLVKKTMQNNKQVYLFEEIGDAGAQAPHTPHGDFDNDAEAFL